MINNVTLVGRLTKDIEVKYTQSGTAVVSFSLAVDRNSKKENGEKETDFPNCVIWGKQAENMAKYCEKGDVVGVVGQLQTRSYENKEGQKVYVTEVNCRMFKKISGKRSSDGQGKQQEYNQQPQQQYQQQPYNQPAQQQYQPQQGQMDMSYQQPPQFQPPQDEELPF